MHRPNCIRAQKPFKGPCTRTFMQGLSHYVPSLGATRDESARAFDLRLGTPAGAVPGPTLSAERLCGPSRRLPVWLSGRGDRVHDLGSRCWRCVRCDRVGSRAASCSCPLYAPGLPVLCLCLALTVRHRRQMRTQPCHFSGHHIYPGEPISASARALLGRPPACDPRNIQGLGPVGGAPGSRICTP